ncbi:N-acetyltransferase [bacterium]|nr:N-acetyltransferase [bacterium]
MAVQNKIGKESLILGNDVKLDDGVILGYKTGRKVKDERLIIGDNAFIRSGSVIYFASRIGSGLETGHNVVIREENEIGDDFSIWSNSYIDYGCKIGNNVSLHVNVYIPQFTTIEDDVFMAPGVTMANDIHPGCPDARKCMRGPHIKRGVKIGVNVTIIPFITIGENCLIASGSVVTRDVPPNSVVMGNPARVAKSIHELECKSGMREHPYTMKE